MVFDGSEVFIGDNVYDVAYGVGKVVQLKEQEGRFMVTFGDGRHGAYQSNGVGNFPIKTLFWRNPIGVVTPPKNDLIWDTFLKLSAELLNSIRAYWPKV